MPKWTTSDIPPQQNRRAIVTGTGGIGYFVALELARAGSEVIVAGRNPAKGFAAVENILHQVAGAKVRFEEVDLASLKSVGNFCSRMRDQHEVLDVLVNNAGIMVPPERQESVDGFELQLATNYLGHFALTAGLLPLLQKGQAARVVSVSSVAARNGTINFADLNASQDYQAMPVYAQSKLACLMFALEFARRSKALGWGVAGLAAHPGVSRTDLLHNAPGRRSLIGLTRSLLWFLFQPASQGALPILYAAAASQAENGGYYGPDRLGETRGFPAPANVPAQALEVANAVRLWDETEMLTGVAFPRGA